MTPLQAIHTATVHAADLLGQCEKPGSITPGEFADLIAVAGDPFKDVTVLERVVFVMQGDGVYKDSATGK